MVALAKGEVMDRRASGRDTTAVALFVISHFACADCRAWFDAKLPLLHTDDINASKIRMRDTRLDCVSPGHRRVFVSRLHREQAALSADSR